MSFNVDWDIDKYREDHESDEHWDLRCKFMERWKNDFCEERLVCLARVFANIELLGCRYPNEVMQEVARLSHDVAKTYRNSRKDKLKRTFVSASDAAEDRARGVNREGGVIISGPSQKSAKIAFVPQGHSNDLNSSHSDNEDDAKRKDIQEKVQFQHESDNETEVTEVKTCSEVSDVCDYVKEMQTMNWADIRNFDERMFYNSFGRMVLLIRPWTSKFSNIQSSCQVCNITILSSYENGEFSLKLNGKLLAQAKCATKLEAKSLVEVIAWKRLLEETVCVFMKKHWIAQGETRISVSDVTKRRGDQFGAPVENSVAAKMMKLMGWKGGGLGADAQGIAEPIKPHLQMVNRAGLGSQSSDIRQLRRAAVSLMQRYIASDTLDVDLVFSSEFSKEERAALHQVASRAGLVSRSYGKDEDRFLVVKKKLDPFSLVRAVLEKGGDTPKYQVFIPVALSRRR